MRTNSLFALAFLALTTNACGLPESDTTDTYIAPGVPNCQPILEHVETLGTKDVIYHDLAGVNTVRITIPPATSCDAKPGVQLGLIYKVSGSLAERTENSFSIRRIMRQNGAFAGDTGDPNGGRGYFVNGETNFGVGLYPGETAEFGLVMGDLRLNDGSYAQETLRVDLVNAKYRTQSGGSWTLMSSPSDKPFATGPLLTFSTQ